MRRVPRRTVRTLVLTALLAAPLAADEPTRLGGLIRWYLTEDNPGRREDILETIRTLTDGDPRPVADAIRRGEHFQRPAAPAFRTGGLHPVFREHRPRIQPVDDSAGDFARLHLPERYDRTRSYPLVLDVGASRLAPEPDAVTVRVDPANHVQAATDAAAAEALVLSVMAHTMDLVNVDPDRIFLRAQGAMAELAWYIALHNPDRFAGLLALQDFWKGAGDLAGHSGLFSILAIERRKGDRALRAFMTGAQRLHEGHLLLRAPADPADDAALLPRIDDWLARTRRLPTPRAMNLLCNRSASLRAHWIRVAPKVRSLRQQTPLAGRFEHRAMSRPAKLRAWLDPEEPNVVHVEAERVTAFEIHVDPELFDGVLPLRVRINGIPGGAKPIHENIPDLLEDYRERRDPRILSFCRLGFAVR